MLYTGVISAGAHSHVRSRLREGRLLVPCVCPCSMRSLVMEAWGIKKTACHLLMSLPLSIQFIYTWKNKNVNFFYKTNTYCLFLRCVYLWKVINLRVNFMITVFVHVVHTRAAKADASWRGLNSLRWVFMQLKESNSLLTENDREILATQSQLNIT